MSRDPHRFVNELDSDAISQLIDRLEKRAKDKVFTALWSKYIDRLTLLTSTQLLEVGCGTGNILRSIALQRQEWIGGMVGIEQSKTFINAAQRFAAQDGVADQIEFHVGDAHKLDFPDAAFDIVIANTVISHVTDPLVVLNEMSRVLKPNGTLVIFDGDYASLTYAYANHAFGKRMDEALTRVTFNNPSIMRDLPRLLSEHGLRITDAWGEAVIEIGDSSYFKSFAATYVPYVLRETELPAADVERWHREQLDAMHSGQFFASCNYCTYLLQHAYS